MAIVPGGGGNRTAPKASALIAAIEIENFRAPIYGTQNPDKQWHPGNASLVCLVDVEVYFHNEEYPVILRSLKVLRKKDDPTALMVFEPDDRVAGVNFPIFKLPFSFMGAISKKVISELTPGALGKVHDEWYKFWSEGEKADPDVIAVYEATGWEGWMGGGSDDEPATDDDEPLEDEVDEVEPEPEPEPTPAPRRRAAAATPAPAPAPTPAPAPRAARTPAPAPAPAAPARTARNAAPAAPAPAPAPPAKGRAAAKPAAPAAPPAGRGARRPAPAAEFDDEDDPFAE